MSKSKLFQKSHFAAKPAAFLFPEIQKVKRDGKCIKCLKPIEEFRDLQSVKEYHISGLCQTCQDEMF